MFYCGYDPGLQAWLQADLQPATPPRWLVVGLAVGVGLAGLLLAVVQP